MVTINLHLAKKGGNKNECPAIPTAPGIHFRCRDVFQEMPLHSLVDSDQTDGGEEGGKGGEHKNDLTETAYSPEE